MPHEISLLIELTFGHLCYHLTDVPPQPNSPSESVFNLDRRSRGKEKTKPFQKFYQMKKRKALLACDKQLYSKNVGFYPLSNFIK
jgi:hypothetical protein